MMIARNHHQENGPSPKMKVDSALSAISFASHFVTFWRLSTLIRPFFR